MRVSLERQLTLDQVDPQRHYIVLVKGNAIAQLIRCGYAGRCNEVPAVWRFQVLDDPDQVARGNGWTTDDMSCDGWRQLVRVVMAPGDELHAFNTLIDMLNFLKRKKQ